MSMLLSRHTRRRDVITRSLAVAFLTGRSLTTLATEAKTYRVAYLALLSGPDIKVVEERLRELGYVPGQNLTFDVQSADGDPERLPRLAGETARTRPDVIIAGFGTLTARAAQAAATTIPVVFASVGDPVGAGIVQSLSRPGANVTGVTSQAADIQGKRLQILEELVPGTRTVGALGNPTTPFTRLALKELTAAAQASGLTVKVLEVSKADQLSRIMDESLAGVAGLITLEDPFLLSLRQELAELAATKRLPIVYGSREFPEAGGLLSYGVNRRDQYRRVAELVDKVLQGAKPSDVPVEQPTSFELVINLKAAATTGITIPPTLLARADEVIE